MTDATVYAVEIFNQTGRPNPDATGLSAALDRFNDNYDTYKESVLELETPVFVPAESRGDGTLGKPANGSSNSFFKVTHLSEAAFIKDLSSSMRFALWVTAISFAVAAILFCGLLRRADVR